jgi:hypothetical protein
MSNATNLVGQALRKVRPGAAARGAGVCLACLVASPAAQSRILFAAYAVGWPLSKPGLQVFIVVPDAEEPWKRATIPFLTSVTSWSTVMLVSTMAVRRTKVPAPIAGVLLGAGVMVVDSLLADLGSRDKEDGDEVATEPDGNVEAPPREG